MAEEQPPPPEERAAQIAAILAGVAAATGTAAAAGAAVTSTAAALAALTRLLLGWGWRRRTVRHALRVTTTTITRMTNEVRVSRVGATPAYDAAIRQEWTYAAWFLERSATRVQEAADAAERAGDDPDAAADAQAQREQRWKDAHERAQLERRKAAEAVDAEAAKPGAVTVDPDDDPGMPSTTQTPRAPRVILSWVTVNDDRATPECVAADGCWFYADTPPLIGYPGQPHGGTCRCRPAPATRRMFLTGRSVDEATADLLDPGHRAAPLVLPVPDDRPDAAAS